VALPVALVAGLIVLRSHAIGPEIDQRPALTVGAGGPNLSTLKENAADRVAAALAKGGGGITFEIVQWSTMVAKPGGPKIAVPDPADRTKTIAMADEYLLTSLAERGIATADGFWAEIREGPAPGEKPDWNAPIRRQALLRDGTLWRNDREGWYETDQAPGIGLDPGSYMLLASLVRNATSLTDAGVEPDNTSLRAIKAAVRPDDIPGLVAANGRSFTELSGPVTFALDPDGQLVKLRFDARNTTMTEFDLMVETEITLRYGVSQPLPDPAADLASAPAPMEAPAAPSDGPAATLPPVTPSAPPTAAPAPSAAPPTAGVSPDASAGVPAADQPTVQP
jgi:hypothetical protein